MRRSNLFFKKKYKNSLASGSTGPGCGDPESSLLRKSWVSGCVGLDGSGSVGCDGPGSAGCDGPDSEGCDGPGSARYNGPGSATCNGSVSGKGDGLELSWPTKFLVSGSMGPCESELDTSSPEVNGSYSVLEWSELSVDVDELADLNGSGCSVDGDELDAGLSEAGIDGWELSAGPGEAGSSFALACGLVELNSASFDLVDVFVLCSSESSKSDNRGVVGAIAWFAVFTSQSSRGPESHRFCDVTVPPPATSTTLTRTSCTSRATTGTASANLIMNRKREIREMAMHRGILVGIVTRIRQRYQLS